jgi:hypothetical protein
VSTTERAAATGGGLARRAALFAVASAVLMFGGAALIATLSGSAEVGRALWTSATIAFVVQLVAFAVAVPFLARNPIMGWGLGSILRLLALVLYAVVGLKMLGLVAAPALLSLAGFLFASMLLETLFLKPWRSDRWSSRSRSPSSPVRRLARRIMPRRPP